MANHSHTLTAQDLWHDIHAVRTQSPLVHSITNFVVMNLNANVLLAAGASPSWHTPTKKSKPWWASPNLWC